MALPFNMTRDINGFNGFGLPFTLDNWQMVLSTNVAQSITIPQLDNYSKYIAVFSYSSGSTVWVAANNVASFPTSSVTTTTSQMNPAARKVNAGDVLSFITGDATNDEVGVSLYGLFFQG